MTTSMHTLQKSELYGVLFLGEEEVVMFEKFNLRLLTAKGWHSWCM